MNKWVDWTLQSKRVLVSFLLCIQQKRIETQLLSIRSLKQRKNLGILKEIEFHYLFLRNENLCEKLSKTNSFPIQVMEKSTWWCFSCFLGFKLEFVFTTRPKWKKKVSWNYLSNSLNFHVLIKHWLMKRCNWGVKICH